MEYNADEPFSGLDRFSWGVTPANAYEWACELRNIYAHIEKTFFHPDASEWELRNGILAIAATTQFSVPQLFGPAARLRGTSTLFGIFESLHHGNSHPLVRPAPRQRVDPAHWNIVKGRAAAAVTILVDAGFSKSEAHSKVAQSLTNEGICGYRKSANNAESKEITPRTIKSWCEKAYREGPNVGTGEIRKLTLDGDIMRATEMPLSKPRAELWLEINSKECANLLRRAGLI